MRRIVPLLLGLCACAPAATDRGEPPRFVEVDAGNVHTCARTDAGGVECWGQCGDICGARPGGFAARLPVFGVTDAVELAVGETHACARTAGGDVMCWGSNATGGFGRAEPDDSPVPMLVPDVHGAVEIAVGRDRTCARLSDGGAMCWGVAAWEAERAPQTAQRRPQRVDGVDSLREFVAPSIGGICDCDLGSDGVVHCVSTSGILTARLADGSSPPDQPPHCPVDGLAGVRTLTERCAIMHDGSVRCWGENFFFGRGDATPIYDNLREPTVVPGITDATELAIGAGHVCILSGVGRLDCWGENTVGQVDGVPRENGVWPPRRIEPHGVSAAAPAR
jgi:alpha-tubulin suppressor-like RCC1 family protein